MLISILTLFPEMFVGPFNHSIIKNAQEKKIVEIELINIRKYGMGKHLVVDDKPFGGGIGMVMRVDVLDKAISTTRQPKLDSKSEKVILLDPRGEVFKQNTAKKFSLLSHLILVCGHYEGFDERVRSLVDQTVSVGDYVLTGGEIPAMTITDATVRLIDGVLKQEATVSESFSSDTELEYPQYTKPRMYKNDSVPEVLLSGNHEKIIAWKKEQSKKITKDHRPDLIKN